MGNKMKDENYERMTKGLMDIKPDPYPDPDDYPYYDLKSRIPLSEMFCGLAVWLGSGWIYNCFIIGICTFFN